MKKIAFLGKGKLIYQIQNLISTPSITFDENGDYPFNTYQNYYTSYKWILGFGYYHMEERVSITEEINQNKGKFYPMCNIDQHCIINQNVLLNNSVTICHNSNIGIGSYISPGVIVCGEVNIGKGCFIGAGSIISNGVDVGDFSTIGVGTVVTKDLPPYSNVIGNPMKVLDKKLKLI